MYCSNKKYLMPNAGKTGMRIKILEIEITIKHLR
jgi:hypothetical protein